LTTINCIDKIFTMIDLDKVKGFDWDGGNLDKSFEKHGIGPNQSEEVFLDENLLQINDIKHSKQEKRNIVIGETFMGSILFVVFAIRKNKIRIISARKANKKERRLYEKKI